MKILFIIVLIPLLLNGCSKYSKQQIQTAHSEYRSSYHKVSSLKKQLNENEAYNNGQCTLLPRGKRPKPYVTTEKEAKAIATPYCLSPVGCVAAAQQLQPDTFFQRYAASETCGQALDKLRADGLVANNSTFNAVESLADSGCDNKQEGFIGWLKHKASCLTSFSAKVVKIDNLNQCLAHKHVELLKTSQDWYYRPSRKRQACTGINEKLIAEQNELSRKRAIYDLMKAN